MARRKKPPVDAVDTQDAPAPVDKALARGGIVSSKKKQPQKDPLYRVVGDSKIPVSRQIGKVHKARVEAAKASRKTAGIDEAWREAIRYYCNDQLAHRDSVVGEASGNRSIGRRRNDSWSETENVVFSNTTTMLPVLYAKNPSCEITPTADDDDVSAQLADTLEDYVNAVASMKTGFGVNLKPKARRAVLISLLTNAGYLKIGYTFKEDSSEEAVQELNDLATKWSEAKTTRDIEEIEGQLQALEDAIELTMPEGPFLKVPSPFNIIIDPESVESDFSDANWIAEFDYMPTAFVRARFLKKKDERQFASLFEPTHVVKLTAGEANGIDDEVQRFSLFSHDNDKQGKFGYSDDEAYEKAKMTKICWVWDKTTRRVFLYHASDWTWPLWVWDDPMKLSRFFPYFRLSFHETPEGGHAKGEVTYYLDQQDAINEINDEERRTRQNIKFNMFFNSDIITSDTVEEVLKGPDGTARGIPLGEGNEAVKINDVLFAYAPDASKYAQFFDVNRKLQAINRISSMNAVLSGEQFKTNTTNKAIENYNDSATIRIDEKTDLIEDWLGDVFQALVELSVMYTPADRIGVVIGKEAAGWQNMSVDDMRQRISWNIVGGSTDKPTSKAKKKEAVEVMQVLGQFANVSPIALVLALQVAEKAFDEIVIDADDWRMLKDAVQQAAMGQQAAPDAAGGQPAGPPGGGGDPQAAIQQLIAKLPPEAKQKMEQLVQQGMPPSQALKTVTQAAQNVQSQTSAQPGR